MTNRTNTRKGMARLTWAWCLMLVLAICTTCISFAAEAKTFDQTMLITQTVSGNASRTKYTYVLKPNIEGSPLPTEGPGTYDKEKNTYSFSLDGNDSIEIPISFTVDKETNYQYLLERVEAVPKGDIVTPDDHHFGYWFNLKDGALTVTPYTCYDNHFEIWDKTDKDGNPVGITLINTIVREEESTTTTTTKPSTTATTRKGQTVTTTKTNVVTRTVSRVVNTGDPYQVGLWVALIVLSLGAIIIIAAIRRKKENDEENS